MTAEVSAPVQSPAGTQRERLLRERLAGRRAAAAAPARLPRADRDAPLPLGHGQQQMWFLNRMEPESTEYLVPFALRLVGELDLDALRSAWQQVLDRHEILRTRYAATGAEPVQQADAPASVELE